MQGLHLVSGWIPASLLTLIERDLQIIPGHIKLQKEWLQILEASDAGIRV